jgi:purine-binding chemotaxis protein CheW
MEGRYMAEAQTATAAQAANLAGRYLTFFLAGEEYGLAILKVREIIGMMSVTPVPQTPDFVAGVINLRGKVIPVIDLRRRFGMPAVEHTSETCTIVVDIVWAGAEAVLMGIIVDTVSEVVDIDAEQIDPPPSFGAGVTTDYILGMGKVGEKVKILLDIDKVLTSETVDAIVNACGETDGTQTPAAAGPQQQPEQDMQVDDEVPAESDNT